jgi:hypothetical protein
MTTARAIFFVILGVTAAFAQDVRVSPYRVNRAAVTDKSLINLFMREQAIVARETPDSLVVIDAASNGFGQGDLLIVYPGEATQPLLSVDEPLRSIMDNWNYNAGQITTPDTAAAQLLDHAREHHDPYRGLLGQIVRGIETYYAGPTIEGAFRCDHETTYLGLWNFDESAFRYREAPLGAAADTIHSYDLLQMISRDTVYVTDTTLYDVIYVYKTYHDTVYVPAPAPHGK